ncbi:uncharacterized protein [Rutidosis leptorrhynchoides]|uniref:uncharacterized protein n=1 Tax=Rutidosis leptorrhynchoides TaxID=125765 RepID=UPI003A9989C9
MENNSRVSSSSSFISDLFDTKESTNSVSTGIFESIFPPPSTANGQWNDLQVPKRRGSSSSWENQVSGNQEWKAKLGAPAPEVEEVSYERNSNKLYQEKRAKENPCHLSSSLHYGGRDVYTDSPNTRTTGSYPKFQKEGPSANNSNDASRGNWWQGSIGISSRYHTANTFFLMIHTTNT